MKKVIVPLSEELLRRTLELPHELSIDSVYYDYQRGCLDLILSGDSLPDSFEVKKGESIRRYLPTLRRTVWEFNDD